MSMHYRTCPACGTSLDPEEKCDCRTEKKKELLDALQKVLTLSGAPVQRLTLVDDDTVGIRLTNGMEKATDLCLRDNYETLMSIMRILMAVMKEACL